MVLWLLHNHKASPLIVVVLVHGATDATATRGAPLSLHFFVIVDVADISGIGGGGGGGCVGLKVAVATTSKLTDSLAQSKYCQRVTTTREYNDYSVVAYSRPSRYSRYC